MSLEMLRDAISAFINREPDKARAVVPRDPRWTTSTASCTASSRASWWSGRRRSSRCLNLMVISKCLERIADHATNIAEEVVYLYEAIDIRHSGQKIHEDKDIGS